MIECPTPLCSTAGAITVTSPSRISSLRKARSPGANTPSSLVSRICTMDAPNEERAGHPRREQPTRREPVPAGAGRSNAILRNRWTRVNRQRPETQGSSLFQDAQLGEEFADP